MARELQDFDVAVVFKKRVKGTQLGNLFGKIKKGNELYTSFIEFKANLANGMANLSQRSRPLFLADIGEQHHRNIMYDKKQKKFFVVDGNLLGKSGFKNYIDSTWQAVPKSRSFLTYGKYLSLTK